MASSSSSVRLPSEESSDNADSPLLNPENCSDSETRSDSGSGSDSETRSDS